MLLVAIINPNLCPNTHTHTQSLTLSAPARPSAPAWGSTAAAGHIPLSSSVAVLFPFLSSLRLTALLLARHALLLAYHLPRVLQSHDGGGQRLTSYNNNNSQEFLISKKLGTSHSVKVDL